MTSTAFDTSWSVAKVKAGVTKPLAGEALGSVVGFEIYN